MLVLILLVSPIVLFLLLKTIKNPIWGLALVFLVYPFESFFPDMGGLTIGRIAGILTTLIWFIYLSVNPSAQSRLLSSKLRLPLILYILTIIFIGVLKYPEYQGERALNASVTILILGILSLMVENLVWDKSKLRLIGTSMALSSALVCIPAFLFVFGIDLYSMVGSSAPTDLSEESLRATAIGGGNPNSLGIVARNGIFASILILSIGNKKIIQFLTWTFLIVCFAGLVLSGSRTNFYGTGIIIATMLFFGAYKFLKNGPRLILIIMGLVIVGFVAFQWAPDPVKTRLLLGRGDDRIADRTSSRMDFTLDQQSQALEFLNDNPFFGVGLDRTKVVTRAHGAHDSISVIIGETGLLGSIAFIYLFIWALLKLLKRLKSTGNFNSRLTISLFGGMLLSFFIMGVSGGFIVIYDRTFWVVLGLIQPIAIILSQKPVETPISKGRKQPVAKHPYLGGVAQQA